MPARSSGREERLVPLVRQHREARLLVEHLAARRIHHAHGARRDGLEQRRVRPAALHQLREQHSLVHQIHAATGPVEPAATKLQLTRVGDDGLDADRGEVLLEQHELAAGGHLGPVHDGHPRQLAPSRPRLVGVEQHVQHAVPRRQRHRLVPPAERPHDRQVGEGGDQRVVVARPSRRLRVVLGERHGARLVHHERVEPRRRAGLGQAGLAGDEPLFPVGQPELTAEGRVRHRALVGLSEGAHQQSHPVLEQPVPVQGHEPRPQHGGERPIPEDEPAAAKLVREHRVGGLGQLVGQQLVVVGDRLLHGIAPSARR